jgi:hypothetical protein
MITSRRCEILKNKLNKIKEFNIGGIKLNINDLQFSPQPKSAYVKINCLKIKEVSSSIIIYKSELWYVFFRSRAICKR